MSNANVISLKALRQLKDAETQELDYHARILSMTKVELLNEMVAFQELRAKEGRLTPTLMARGRILFGALEQQAETEALRALTRSYRRHLEHEMRDFAQNGERPHDSEAP